jgi:drug/metabolite transporter (DMT)-like permease
MDIKNIGLLIALSAIWCSSFIFMRYLSPLLGAVITADLRLLIAGLFLVGFFAIMGVTLDWRKNWRQYLSQFHGTYIWCLLLCNVAS